MNLEPTKAVLFDPKRQREALEDGRKRISFSLIEKQLPSNIH